MNHLKRTWVNLSIYWHIHTMSEVDLDCLAKAWTKRFFIFVAVGSVITVSACTVAVIAIGCCRCCINPCCIYVRVWCLVVFNRPQFHFASSDSKQALSGCIPPQLSSCHIFSGDFTPTMCHHIFDLISNRFSFNLFFFLYFFFWLSMDVSVSKTTWYIFICWMTGGQRGAHLKFKTQSVAVNGVCFTFWHYVESYIAKSAYLSSLPMVCQDLKLSIFTKDTFLSILFINLSKYVLVSTSPLPR